MEKNQREYRYKQTEEKSTHFLIFGAKTICYFFRSSHFIACWFLIRVENIEERSYCTCDIIIFIGFEFILKWVPNSCNSSFDHILFCFFSFIMIIFASWSSSAFIVFDVFVRCFFYLFCFFVSIWFSGWSCACEFTSEDIVATQIFRFLRLFLRCADVCGF